MKNCLTTIAMAMGYEKFPKLVEKIDNIDESEIASIIQSSTQGPSCFLFFPGLFYEISPFGLRWSHFTHRNQLSSHHVLSHPDLSEKYLRKLFTGIEMILFKLCHIVFHNQGRSYSFESEKATRRFNKLKTILNMPDWNEYKAAFDDIMFVRNAFAHSFMQIGEIKYKGVELKICFGPSYIGRPYGEVVRFVGSIFTEDVAKFFEPISKCYEQHQLKQIDKEKFFGLLDHKLKERSLLR